MADSAWYTEWFNSPFYHQLYAERDEESGAFMSRLLGHLQPPAGSRLLDTACGRGGQAGIMAASGFDVTGVDPAPDNIAAALQSATPELQFFLHDIRLPFWVNYFDYAFNLFSGFGYFRTRREHDDAMRTIAGSLKPGGFFVIDYPNTHFAEEHPVRNETRQIGAARYDMLRWDDEGHFYKKITITDPSLPEPLSFTAKTAKFSLGDFTDMMAFQSMQVQEVFGDYQLNPYHIRNTPRLIIIAQKKVHSPGDKEKRLYSDGRATDALT